MTSFEEIMGADGNEDLTAALSAAEQDFADAARLRDDAGSVEVAAVDRTDTIGSVAPDGTLFGMGYREQTGGREAYIVVAVGSDTIWMPVAYATDLAEWLTSRVTKAKARGREL